MIGDTVSTADLVRELSPARVGAFEACVSVWSRCAGGARAGGDWCDVVAISEDIVAVTVGDVSGHGPPVAKAMETSVLGTIHDARVPSGVLALANHAAFHHGGGTIVAFVNCRQQTLAFATSGHPPPLLLTVAYAIALRANALLVFYTDGITEHDRDLIRGEAELAEAARCVFERPDTDAAHAIARQLVGKRPLMDDATTIVLRLPPPSLSTRTRGRV